MIVIVKYKYITMIEHFKVRFIRYWLYILKWKLKGAEVSILKESEIR